MLLQFGAGGDEGGIELRAFFAGERQSGPVDFAVTEEWHFVKQNKLRRPHACRQTGDQLVPKLGQTPKVRLVSSYVGNQLPVAKWCRLGHNCGPSNAGRPHYGRFNGSQLYPVASDFNLRIVTPHQLKQPIRTRSPQVAGIIGHTVRGLAGVSAPNRAAKKWAAYRNLTHGRPGNGRSILIQNGDLSAGYR
ncbi:MAG: hypothetical protein Kow0031_22000 [Anaerolineae bacterium]